jgi:hypothetical protein
LGYIDFVCLAGLAFAGFLFAWKYASHLGLGPLFPATAYLVGFLALAWLIGKLPRRLFRRPWLWVGAYMLAAVPPFLLVDPIALKVDRWSALTNFLGACLRGDFPYAKLSHLGHPISGFPILFLLAVPFYSLGDVGWMQFAALAAFAVLSRREGGRPEVASVAVLLLFAQPGFHYEVLARSDLFANMTVAAWCLYGSDGSGEERSKGRFAAEACLWGALLATRGIAGIPFLLCAGAVFRKRGPAWASAFGLIAGLVAAAAFLPFYLWDPEAFRAHNPLSVQAGYAPLACVLPVAGAAFCLGYADSGGGRKFRNAGLLIFSLVTACFLRAAMGRGWEDAVNASGFDLTYFTLSMPFLILALAESGALAAVLRPDPPQKP